MDQKIICAGFEFFCNFDSSNLARVELVPPGESIVTQTNNNAKRVGVVPEVPDFEFNIWTRPDCFGTEFENSNRTWFYFGMRASGPALLVKLNLVDLNKQAKMYSQGMAPVYRVLPGKPHWERIRDRPTYSNEDVFTLSFKYKTPENPQCTTYFAFTYPYSYMDLQNNLTVTDSRFILQQPTSKDDIYYVRECICYSLEGRRIDLITVSSYHNITAERETRLKSLFPEYNHPRPFRFVGKKVIFISARVHPGETPSSFVFNGFLNLLTTRDDPIAISLRKKYVFKLIPCLNPDGVSRGHYRTDTRGVNLNRVYLRPSFTLHPSVYAARALLRYYHYGVEKEESGSSSDLDDVEIQPVGKEEKAEKSNNEVCAKCSKKKKLKKDKTRECECSSDSDDEILDENLLTQGDNNSNESGLYIYVDMHGHASKKGIFMYGNHFEELEQNVECMLLPKLMSLNNHNFHFTACNFTERNMYLKDKRDGMSREGSGRVAVLKTTGLIRSYTLECNYNTGRLVNVLPPTIKELNMKSMHTILVPPKYNPHVFEEVGIALGASILDLTGSNPLTRLPGSEFHSLSGLREWLRIHCSNEFGDGRLSGKLKLKNVSSLNNQIKTKLVKSRSISAKATQKRAIKAMRSTSVPIDRKENMASSDSPQPSCSHTSSVGSSSSVESPKPKPIAPRQTKTIALKTRQKKEIILRNKNRSPPGDKTQKRKSIIAADAAAAGAPSTSNVNPSRKACTKIDLAKTPSKLRCPPKLLGKEMLKPDQRVQLREICLVKDGESKKLIAKYNKSETSTLEDNLIVAWDSGGGSQPKVFTQKNVMPRFLTGDQPGPSCSRQGAFRVHNFSKGNSYAKVKRNGKRNSLRRLSGDAAGKVDKRKRKKVKPKT